MGSASRTYKLGTSKHCFFGLDDVQLEMQHWQDIVHEAGISLGFQLNAACGIQMCLAEALSAEYFTFWTCRNCRQMSAGLTTVRKTHASSKTSVLLSDAEGQASTYKVLS